MTSAARTTDPAGRMSLWRLEWLRLTRTPRAIALGSVFVVFGLVEPAVTRYQSQIFRHVGNGVRISFPPATPGQGISSYASELSGIGLIVVVVIAAGAFSFDARPGLATFLRTRVASTWQLVTPRFTVWAAAAAAAYLLGTLTAWAQTGLLIAAPAVGGLLYGILCGGAYLVFAVAVTALAASVVRSTLAAVGVTLALLLLLPIAGVFHAVDAWLPTTLASAPGALATQAQHLSHYVPTFAMTVAVSAAALTAAVSRLRVRDV